MLIAALWGGVGGISLLAGAVLGLATKPTQRTIGLVMAFGAGVLISALTFELFTVTGFSAAFLLSTLG